MSSPGAGGFDRLAALLDGASQPPSLAHLIEAGADDLPLPGDGRTLARWQALTAVATRDLTLIKLFEGHTDALAILAELGGPAPPPASRWGTWCAEPPDARVELRESANGSDARLHGTKSWCSGAASSTHAVISCWNARGEPCLAAVALDQPGVTVTDTGWHAVGMAGTGSVDVRFDDAAATPVGQPGDYVARPGFWQGGAGIAACWYGGAQGIAEMTRRRLGPKPDAHRLAHLGAIDVALAGAAAVLREAAAWIDAHPRADAQRVAARARLAVEHAATRVLDHAGRALGAGPLCRDARFARAMADLPVFLRQSHAERDLASLGTGLLPEEESPWKL
ncbi:acyl-CoA dehydrogenase [Variovorax sp. PvP013]|uniref:acyl-CoA dehydrogenase n=1 Tax=Variovorax sp. PvP013 TaxID=3156435 RepID=UPI003D20C7E4